MTSSYEGSEPIVRDRRRIDPLTGEVRQPVAVPDVAGITDVADLTVADGTVPAGTVPTGGEDAVDITDSQRGLLSNEDLADLRSELAERTADLQRVQAEYANYRRRVDRDRVVTQEIALAGVLASLFPVLDDIGRARQHGELEGGFKSVAEALEATVAKLGLEQFAVAGDPFDPQLHEALTHGYAPDVTVATAGEVYQPGYRLGERVLRPARVAVVEPQDVVAEVEDEA